MVDLCKSNKIKVCLNGRSILINPEDIGYCHAEGCYSRIFLISGKSYLLSKPLNDLEKQLSDDYFFRCHRSYLVNISEIFSVDSDKRMIHQKLYQIPVSYRKLIDLLYKCNAYIINKK